MVCIKAFSWITQTGKFVSYFYIWITRIKQHGSLLYFWRNHFPTSFLKVIWFLKLIVVDCSLSWSWIKTIHSFVLFGILAKKISHPFKLYVLCLFINRLFMLCGRQFWWASGVNFKILWTTKSLNCNISNLLNNGLVRSLLLPPVIILIVFFVEQKFNFFTYNSSNETTVI